MNKNCIACTICNTFIHGKCINLTSCDIKKIESVDKSYICPMCLDNILPRFIAYDISPKKAVKKQNIKTCLMCTNDIKKNKYPNKCDLYDGVKKFLCEPCSKKGIENPFRDTNLVEFLDCTICKKNVNYESIFCNTCHHLIHPSCNGLNRAQFELLGKTDEPWSCKTCVQPSTINKKIKTNLII